MGPSQFLSFSRLSESVCQHQLNRNPQIYSLPDLQCAPLALQLGLKDTSLNLDARNQNSIHDLAELLVFLEAGDGASSSLELSTEIRIASADIDDLDTDISLTVSLRRAWLHLDLEGFNVSPQGRHGDSVIQSSAVATTTTAVTTGSFSAGGSLSGAADVETPKIGFKGSASVGGAFEQKDVLQMQGLQDELHIPVKARPNNRWEITKFNNGLLDGTFMNGSILCQIKHSNSANRHAGSLTLEVSQKDLILQAREQSRISFFSNNKKKLLGIFIAKSMSIDANYNGKIVLCKSEWEDES